MYKCTECEAEYKTKPDFCDCGNNIFNEIKESETVIQNSVLKQNLPSVIFLIICIILSFIILFFVANPKNELNKKEQKHEMNIVIPDIDDIWNDEKPKQSIIRKTDTIIATEIKQESKKTKVNLKKEPYRLGKNVQKPKQIQAQKIPNNSKVQSVQKMQAQIQKPKVQQTIIENTKVQEQSQQVQNSQTTSQNIQATPIKQSNPDELKQYKKALRNKIASNIDFLSVAGDGKCSLSFNISQSGVLLNRKFVSQSQNTSLNNAVYQAMLRVSSFKVPPGAYKNETLKLIVQITAGNFSVSLE